MRLVLPSSGNSDWAIPAMMKSVPFEIVISLFSRFHVKRYSDFAETRAGY